MLVVVPEAVVVVTEATDRFPVERPLVLAEQFHDLVDAGRPGEVGPRGALPEHERMGVGIHEAGQQRRPRKVDHRRRPGRRRLALFT